MNKSDSRRELRWLAVRIFIVPPAFFAIAGVVSLVSEAGVSRSTPFLVQVASGLLAVAVTAYFLAPVFAPICRRLVVAGCIFGVTVCAAGGFAFGITAALGYPDFSFRAYVWRPLGWFALFGFPVAALTGLLFSGAAQRITPPAQSNATNVANEVTPANRLRSHDDCSRATFARQSSHPLVARKVSKR